jgi:hypothetical protein
VPDQALARPSVTDGALDPELLEADMLLETRIDDKTTLVLDCESVGGIDKGTLSVTSHPDKVLTSTIAAIRAVGAQLGTAAQVESAHPPDGMEVVFGVRVDSNAVVSLARSHETAQFRVTLRWSR